MVYMILEFARQRRANDFLEVVDMGRVGHLDGRTVPMHRKEQSAPAATDHLWIQLLWPE